MKKLISFVLVICMMMTLCTINAHGAEPDRVDPNSADFIDSESQQKIDREVIDFSEESAAKEKAFGSSDLYSADKIEAEEPEYVDGEVLIGIANSPEARELAFSSFYSDDYIRINRKNTCARRTEAEPIQSVKKQLNLDLNLTEMELLNPSVEKKSEGKFHPGDDSNDIFLLKFTGKIVEEAIQELSENPLIEYAEPNYLVKVDTVPNDPLYSAQYALEYMNVPEAWNTTTGSQDVVVGIIDTGIDGAHPDLVDNLWSNPYFVEGTGCSVCSQNEWSYGNDDIHGYNFSGAGNDGVMVGGTPEDLSGHGTEVAGVIGAKGNNALCTCGVNWNVSLAWLGCSYSPGGLRVDKSAIVKAIKYADAHNIMILNCSFGSNYFSNSEFKAFRAYRGLAVCSAGNEAHDIDNNPHYPAAYDCPNILTVASTNDSGDLASSSCVGTYDVDVAAPGDDIQTLYPTHYSQNTYVDSGTSFAAPQVAGIAALVKSVHSDYTTQQIKAAICGTVQQQGKNYHVANDGGIVDAATAVSVSSSSLKKVTFHFNYPGAAPSTFEDYVYYGHKYGYPPEATTIFSALSDPNLPNSGEYVFDGWYTTASAVTPFNFFNPVYSNKNVYAKWVQVPANTEESYGKRFPDYRFRNVVLNMVNAHDGGTRTAASLVTPDISYFASFTALDISNNDINCMKGIELFSGLHSLDCSHNRIKDINQNLVYYTLLSGLNQLEVLDCSDNRIRKLYLNFSTALKHVDCSNNGLVDVNHSDSLEYLNCSKNAIEEITPKAGLVYLDCSNNKLTSLTTNDNLEHLECSNNVLESLTTNADLEYLNCSHNWLRTYIPNTGLVHLDCSHNHISSLSTNANLEYLDCSHNWIRTFTTNNGLEYLNCSDNHLSSFTAKASLEYLNCSNNELTSLTTNVNLEHLDCSNNRITSLATKAGLEYLNCNDNRLNKLVVQASTGLDTLYCKSNKLYVINTLGLSDLGNVDVSYNQMSSKSDVIGYTHWDYPAGVFYNQFNPQQPWSQNWCTDVSDSTYYYKAVEYVLSNGYMSTTANLFRPNATMTRLELAVTLYKMAGKPSVSGLSVPFTDISNLSNDELKAVKWNYNNGNQVIMGGTSGTLFSPSLPATRETVAVVLTRYATRMNVTLTKIRDYVPFTDDAQISNWARASIVTLYEAGILNGSSGYYYPKTNIIRGDVAVFVRKFKVIPQYLS